jgi:hypothetical protein
VPQQPRKIWLIPGVKKVSAGGEVSMFGKLIHWVKVSIAKVPEEIAICEFDCREKECRLQDWARCERRLHQRNSWRLHAVNSQRKKQQHRSH